MESRGQSLTYFPSNKKIKLKKKQTKILVIKTVPQSNGESSNKNNAVFMEMAKYSADDFKACTVTVRKISHKLKT